MSINRNDMEELRRLSTNTYDGDKACMNRVIRGITLMENEIRELKLENERLKAKLNQA